jgi:Zn-dependent M16 (insulinase) family peptidase
MVNLRLRAHFSEAHWGAEHMEGIAYLLFLRKLAGRVETDWSGVLSALEEIRGTLINRGAAIFNLTLEEGAWKQALPALGRLAETLPEKPLVRISWPAAEQPLFEGMTVPSRVNYVGKAGDLYDHGYRFHGSALVITRYLRTAWLWDRVRVQGGAYGAFCLLDRLSGVLSMVSYRDPNLAATLEAFDRAADFLSDRPIAADELTKSIIGAIGDLDTHLLPDAKGYTSMLRYLTGDTDEDRQDMRDEVLGTGEADFKAFGEMLARVNEKGIVKVLGSAEAIKEANAARGGWLEVLNLL